MYNPIDIPVITIINHILSHHDAPFFTAINQNEYG